MSALQTLHLHPFGFLNASGHQWTGEITEEGACRWFHYLDQNGNEYQSKEVPAKPKGDSRGQTDSGESMYAAQYAYACGYHD